MMKNNIIQLYTDQHISPSYANDAYLEDIQENECQTCMRNFHYDRSEHYDLEQYFCSIECKNNWVLSEYDEFRECDNSIDELT